MGIGKSLASVTCEQCGTVLMETFLSTHMRYVHTDAADLPRNPASAGYGQIKKRSKSPSEQPTVKVAPPAKAQLAPPPAAMLSALALKKPRVMVQEIEHRVIVVRYNEPRPKVQPSPVKPAKLRCANCFLEFKSQSAAFAHLKNGTCPAITKHPKRRNDRKTKAPRSFLPDGFEPSSSVKTVSGGLPGLGKRSR